MSEPFDTTFLYPTITSRDTITKTLDSLSLIGYFMTNQKRLYINRGVSASYNIVFITIDNVFSGAMLQHNTKTMSQLVYNKGYGYGAMSV